jgi:hypothetical protein
MADGFAQATGRPALVNLHAAAGLGNAMGNLINTQAGHVPVIITSGQQARKYTGLKAYLTNVDAPKLAEPLVKWSHEPARPQDAPQSLSKAILLATAAPAGPVYLCRWMTGITTPMPARWGGGSPTPSRPPGGRHCPPASRSPRPTPPAPPSPRRRSWMRSVRTAILTSQARQLETAVGTALLRTGPDGQLALTAYGQLFAGDVTPVLKMLASP